MHSFKNTIITTTDRFRIELLQTSSKQITPLSLLRIFAHLLYTIAQNLAHELRLTWNLRRVLRHILNHGPQVQEWSPIYVPKIRKKHMGLVTTHKRIITGKASIPLTFTTALLNQQTLYAPPRRMREPVATIITSRFPPRTSILRRRRVHVVAVMTITAIHQRRQELPQRSQVHLRTRLSTTFIQQQTLQETAQANCMWR